MAARQTYDAIVVGTGPGGATTARELTNRNKKVLLLEWGSNAPIKGSTSGFMSGLGVPGRSLLLTNNLVSVVRGVTTGGSSIFYYATAFDPPLDMLAKHGVDLAAEVNEVKKELPIAPLADHLIGPMAKRIMSTAQDMGYEWRKLNKYIYQNKCRPRCWKCEYGCPYGAKWNARMYVEEAVAKGAVLISGANVKKVLFEGRSAAGVEYTRRGATHRVRAPLVIISAGGIGSPIILRASGLKSCGQDFFYDPLITVMGEVEGIKGGAEIPMATGIHLKGEGFMMTDMTVPKELYWLLTAEVFRFSRLRAHPRTLTIMIKAQDALGGRITDGGGVRKPLSEGDRKKLLRGFNRAKRILGKAGAKDVYKSWYLASHPGGTVKIGEAVDSDLKTEYDRLYVCDCSVIPEAWGLPPTLTLISLGKRLAKHLTGS
ncbi:MAG: FAD-dependent oxidoreductase [Thermodesulfobacteriota bacterium]